MSAKKAAKKGHGTAAKRVETAPLIVKQDAGALTTRQLAVIFGIGFVFGVGVLYEWGQLNGLPLLTNWGWPWQDLGSFQMGLALLAPFLVIAGVLWVANRETSRIPLGVLLGALVLAHFSLQLLSVFADPRGVERISQIVSSANATGYFTDALHIQNLREWMAHFHQANVSGHARTHPPGPILFYYISATLFGTDMGSFLGGYAVGLVASLGTLVMYAFAGLWTSDRNARLCAAAFYALLPGLTVFFPEFDQIYPIFAMAMIFYFVGALNEERRWSFYALAMGLAVFIATFFAYNLLLAGAFPLYYAIYWWWRRGRTWTAALTVVRAAAVSLAATACLYGLLWATTGYKAVAALRHALHAQQGVNEHMGRGYGISLFADPYDFLLAVGIIAAPILWFHLRKVRKQFEQAPDAVALTVIGLATILTVDGSGLLRGETARVWLFLQPLVVVPVALELGRVRWPWRMALFTMQWWLLVVIKAKMSFVEP